MIKLSLMIMKKYNKKKNYPIISILLSKNSIKIFKHPKLNWYHDDKIVLFRYNVYHFYL